MEGLTLAQIKSQGIELNEYRAKQVGEELGQKIAQFVPVMVLHYFSDEYYEYSQVSIKNESFPIRVSAYKGKYNLHANFNHLKNVTRYDVIEVEKEFQAPQQIGVLTQKKVNAWLTYWTEVYNVLKAKDNVNQGVKEAFLKSLEGLPVHWYTVNKKGYISQNGIEFEFTIHETHVEKKLSISHKVPTGLDSFLKLSANGFATKI